MADTSTKITQSSTLSQWWRRSKAKLKLQKTTGGMDKVKGPSLTYHEATPTPIHEKARHAADPIPPRDLEIKRDRYLDRYLEHYHGAPPTPLTPLKSPSLEKYSHGSPQKIEKEEVLPRVPPRTLLDRSSSNLRLKCTQEIVEKKERPNIRRLSPVQEIFPSNVENARRAVIVVLGITGSGKSSFIRRVTGRSDIIIGQTLRGETDEIKTYDWDDPENGGKYTLVDTPGFNDTTRDDMDIYCELAEWLKNTYEAGTRISGIVYLHPITERRMKGPALRNFKMLQNLCGDEYSPNIVLATTLWDILWDKERGEKAEKELKETQSFWRSMIEQGARVCRLDAENGRDREVIRILGEGLVFDPVLRIQKEMVEQRVSGDKTRAAFAIKAELARLCEENRKREEEAEWRRKKKLDDAKREREQIRERRIREMEEEERILEAKRKKLKREQEIREREEDLRRQAIIERERAKARAERAAFEREVNRQRVAYERERQRIKRVENDLRRSARVHAIGIAKRVRGTCRHCIEATLLEGIGLA